MKISEMNLITVRFDDTDFDKKYRELSQYDYITFNCSECGKEFTVHKYSFSHPSEQHLCKGCKNRHYLREVCDLKERTRKCKRTKLEKHGNENWNNQDKNKLTCLERYGVEHVFKLKKVISKCEQTREENSGYKYYTQQPEVRKRMKEWITSDEFKEKSEKTSLENHGCRNGGGSKQAHSKMHKKYTYNKVSFDSSWELAIYIYLVDNNICFEYQPDVFFEYIINNITKRYFPDFKIDGVFYEVKGDQFFEDGKMINPFDRKQDYIYEAKHQCMIDNNVKILTMKDMQPYLDHILIKYGNKYLEQFRNV